MTKPSLRRFLPFKKMRDPAPVVTVLRLSGVIGQAGPMRRGLSLASLAGPIERAFKPRHLKAVALAVNSPGGSPVQSALIARRIRALADEKEVPVFAFAEDVAASGGYWLACAGDEIFVDESSVVGSIGVVSGGFGFPELLKKAGVERRLHTSGDRKALLDPFSRERPEDVEHLKSIQERHPRQFQNHGARAPGRQVEGRARPNCSAALSGPAAKAVEMGLADGIGDLRGVLRERYGEKVKLRVVTAEQPWLRRRLGLSRVLPGGHRRRLGRRPAGRRRGTHDLEPLRALGCRSPVPHLTRRFAPPSPPHRRRGKCFGAANLPLRPFGGEKAGERWGEFTERTVLIARRDRISSPRLTARLCRVRLDPV